MPDLQNTHRRASLLVADASQLSCQLLETALRSRRNGIAVVASAVSLATATELLKEFMPDVAVIGTQLQEGNLEGYRLVRELRLMGLKTRAVMLLDSHDRRLVVDAFRSGAQGVVFRDEPLETLAKCVHAVHQGQVWANSENLGYVLDALRRTMPLRFRDGSGLSDLSKRELEVVALVADGLTNKQISAQLHLSDHTIRNYLNQIYATLKVTTRVELVLLCLQERQRGTCPVGGERLWNSTP